MRKKGNQKLIDDNFNQDNTYNLFLPSTLKRNKTNNVNDLTNKNLNIIFKNKSNKKDENNLSKNYSNGNDIQPLKNPSLDLPKIEVSNNIPQIKPKKSKKKLKIKNNSIINEINVKNEINTKKEEIRKRFKTITINEVENKCVPSFSKNKKHFNSISLFFIFRRNLYPINFNSKSKLKEALTELSKELKIEKNLLEFRINERIITEKDEETNIKQFINEEKEDKIYVTKMLSDYMINNLYNKSYNNIVIIENNDEIEDIEKKLNKYLEEYHMEKDYFFKKIKNYKYSFGFSFPDFAFNFNRLLLLLKRTEEDFKNIKSYLKLEKKRKITNFPFLGLLSVKNNNNNYKNLSVSYDKFK